MIHALEQQHSHFVRNTYCHRLRHSFSSSSSPSRNSPSTPSSVERSAKLVKNTDVTNPYLEQVRAQVVDPALQIKTIEDELCGAIGKALGKQGEKVLFAVREMKQERRDYLAHINGKSFDDAVQSATRYNDARERAMKARWELLVHRQAVGFTVDNHSVVHTTFPIGEPLPEKEEEIKALALPSHGDSDNLSSDTSTEQQQPAKKVWGDQLSWWQQKGRWK